MKTITSQRAWTSRTESTGNLSCSWAKKTKKFALIRDRFKTPRCVKKVDPREEEAERQRCHRTYRYACSTYVSRTSPAESSTKYHQRGDQIFAFDCPQSHHNGLRKLTKISSRSPSPPSPPSSFSSFSSPPDHLEMKEREKGGPICTRYAAKRGGRCRGKE